MFEAVGGGAGSTLRATGGGDPSHAAPRGAGGDGRDFTDEEGAIVGAEAETVEPDPEVRSRAQQIAARLSIPRPRIDVSAPRGAGRLVSLPYQGGSDDIDLDRTLEVLTARPVPDDEDIVVRDRMRTRRSAVLALDVSGSMRGERVRTAAATVGALAGELAHDALAVIAFWSDAAIVHRLGDLVRPSEILDRVLRLPAQGLTNVAFPLELAARQLERAPARESRVLLLSDCVHNAGPDPRPLAARLPRLDVLLDADGENDLELGRELAASGRGRLRVIRNHRDVAPSLGAVFGE
ncbi:vWA domain-containing protein [Microbacterium halotolerans]|uniref:vWA domain-containing protein n=1 Tax=Microbacterium halotolerans TaxID=246613 RepID=UPI00196933E7|nr:VWA domain-containing protein [Microbacterium halotolerans]